MSRFFNIVFNIIICIVYMCAFLDLIILFFVVGWFKFLIIILTIILGCVFARILYDFVDRNINSENSIKERRDSNSMKVFLSSIIDNLSYLSLAFSIILLILEMFNRCNFIQHIINLVETVIVVGSIYIIGISFVNNMRSRIIGYHTLDGHIRSDIKRDHVGKKYKDLKSEKSSLIRNRIKECWYIFLDVVVIIIVIAFVVLFWINRYNEYKYM